MPSETFWAGDMGVKLIQVESLLRGRFSGLALDYPGRHIDPEGAYFPIRGLFAAALSGRHYAVFPPLFPVLSALPYALLGHVGLYVLPLASGVLLLWLSLSIAGRIDLGPHTAYFPVLLGLGSPVFLYSVVFWAHVPAAALCLVGFVLATARGPGAARWLRVAGAGAAVGIAAAMRPECNWFAVGCVAACVLPGGAGRRSGLRFALGFGLVTAACWAFNTAAFGHPLGLHYALNLQHRYGASPSLAARAAQACTNAVRLLLNPSTERVVNLWVHVPLGLFFLACFTRWRWLIAVTAALTIPALVTLCIDPHLKEGLLAVSPVCMFALAGGPGPHSAGAAFRRDAARVLLLFIAGVLLTTPTAGGWQFGPRLLLPAFPLLLLLSVQGMIALGRRCGLRVVACVYFACVCAGFAAAFHAVRIADLNKNNWRQFARAIDKLDSRVIVTDRPYVVQSLASLYYKRLFFLLPDPDATDLLNRIAHAGFGEFLYISNTDRLPADPTRRQGFRRLEPGPQRTFAHSLTFREYRFVP